MRDNPTMDKIFGALTFSKRFPRLGHGPKTKEHRDCQLTREDTARSWDFIFFIISLANLLLLLSLAATNIDKISEYYFLWISSFVHLVMAIAKTEHSYIYSGWLGLGVTFVAVLFSFAPYASVIFFNWVPNPCSGNTCIILHGIALSTAAQYAVHFVIHAFSMIPCC